METEIFGTIFTKRAFHSYKRIFHKHFSKTVQNMKGNDFLFFLMKKTSFVYHRVIAFRLSFSNSL